MRESARVAVRRDQLRRPVFHAIYAVLNEADLFAASVASLYNFVDGITVVTEYDRDWTGKSVDPDHLVSTVLDRSVDPDRKINLIVVSETNEARARNRAMDLAHPGRQSRRVRIQHPTDRLLASVDYFWIVDADEIYEAPTIPKILAYVARHGSAYYRVAARTYFKAWNYQVEGFEWFTAFVRSDRRLGGQRYPYPTVIPRVLGHLRMPKTAIRVRGVQDVPPEVGYFHHGSYVGPYERIASKLANFSHSTEIQTGWIDDVWSSWTPDKRNFHPLNPSAFPSARRLRLQQLPPEIRLRPWPAGYLEPDL